MEFKTVVSKLFQFGSVKKNVVLETVKPIFFKSAAQI